MTKTFKLLLVIGFAMQTFAFSLFAAPNTKKTTAKSAPLSFIENKGQVVDQNRRQRGDIDFKLTAANGLNIFIGDGAIHYQFSKCNNPEILKQNPNHKFPNPNSAPVSYDMYRMDVELVGANKNAKVVTSQKQDYFENYFT